jgi:hypothetical protein
MQRGRKFGAIARCAKAKANRRRHVAVDRKRFAADHREALPGQF